MNKDVPLSKKYINHNDIDGISRKEKEKTKRCAFFYVMNERTFHIN